MVDPKVQEKYYRESCAEIISEKDAKIMRLKKLLLDLTPSGSEFVNDPQRCFEYAKDQIAFKPRRLLEAERRLEQATALLRKVISENDMPGEVSYETDNEIRNFLSENKEQRLKA